MATWSLPVQRGQQGWKLRVLSGTSLGKEFDLPLSRYVLGSQAPSNIVIPDPSISPQHVSIEIRPDHILLTDCSRGAGMTVNGKTVLTTQAVPGDHVQVGNFKFEFSNPNYVAKSPLAQPGTFLHKLLHLPMPVRVGLITFTVAAALYILLVTTWNPNLVPVTVIAMSAVVPATMICFLVEKYDTTGISFHTLVITFLAGGTVGIIAAMINYLAGEMLTGGLLLLPIFAGLYEEPAKFVATSWRWRHPRYDRPMDGLIIGTVSGLGFAVFESAGYGFTAIATQGLDKLLYIMVIRGISSPFGHGLWSGIVAAAFWQCGRSLKRAAQSRTFQLACLWAVGLHALWNASAPMGRIGYAFTILSAALSLHEYRKLLANKGYRLASAGGRWRPRWWW
jgi:RsiW-degrading membrane proteinase PrsW (M82 family)